MRSLQRAVAKDGKAILEHLPHRAYRVSLRDNDGKVHAATVDVPEQAVGRLP